MLRRFWLTLLIMGAMLAAGTGTAAATSVFQSVTVKAPADKVWALIGPFCSIKDWHPVIGQCTEAGGVRTLTTKNGKAQFIEKETARGHTSYTYTIEKSPLPLKNCKSTLQLLAQGDGQTKVEWSSSFTPDEGHEEEASEVVGGIYREGLENIVKLVGK